MDTLGEQRVGANESSIAEAIAELGLDAQVTFARVSAGLGLPGPESLAIGRYQIRAKLGEGGMGVVYLAYDPRLDREVAVKLVTTRPLRDPDKLRERLLREAQLLAKLSHPNIVRIYDSGEHAGEVFLAMEYVDGQDLRQWQETPGRTRRQILELYIRAGRGLAAAHAEGIVHRDFKPDNVLIGGEDQAIVGDFGLAHLLAEPPPRAADSGEAAGSVRVSVTGELLGTPIYMAPEQLRGEAVDARSDQYSYCVALWEALCGRRPYEGTTRAALLAALRDAEPGGGEGLPGWLRRALRTGLAAAPERRHRDMNELVAALERGLGRGARWLFGAALGLAGVLTLGGGWALAQRQPPPVGCAALDEVTALAESPGWLRFLDRVGAIDPRSRAGFEDELRTLARDACTKPEATAGRIDQFERVAEQAPEWSSAQLGEVVVELERGRLIQPPPEPLSPEVEQVLTHLVALENQESLAELVRETDALLAAHEDSQVDQAELLLQRGRAELFRGNIEAAVADFKAARRAAEVARYDDARLRALSLAAKTTVMRLEDVDAGRELVEDANAVLGRLDEPPTSPRRTDLREIEVGIDRREGRLDLAVAKQRQVVSEREEYGNVFEQATAKTMLGVIEEFRGDLPAAERAYRSALELVPDDLEAAHNLAGLLANRGEDGELSPHEREEAHDLLARVLAGERGDLHLHGQVIVVQLALQVDDAPTLATERARLVELLTHDPSVTPTHAAEAWAYVALAHATLGELGPGFADALARLAAAGDAALLAQVELEAAKLATDGDPSLARELASRALARFEALSADDLASARADARALLDRLDQRGPATSD